MNWPRGCSAAPSARATSRWGSARWRPCARTPSLDRPPPGLPRVPCPTPWTWRPAWPQRGATAAGDPVAGRRVGRRKRRPDRRHRRADLGYLAGFVRSGAPVYAGQMATRSPGPGSRTYTSWPCACRTSRSCTVAPATRSTRSAASPSCSSVPRARTPSIPSRRALPGRDRVLGPVGIRQAGTDPGSRLAVLHHAALRRPPATVLVRGSRIGELTVQELTEVVQDAWLAQASRARAAAWLGTRPGASRCRLRYCPDNGGRRRFLRRERSRDVRRLDRGAVPGAVEATARVLAGLPTAGEP